MIEKEKEGIRWLEFELLQEERCHLAHAVFLRHGGVSQKPYDSLNLGGGSGDDPSLVAINRQRVLSVLPSSDPVSGYQVHGDHIEVVRKGWNFEGGCDGLITEEKKRSLMIKHADCQAAIFYDPMQRRLANVHC